MRILIIEDDRKLCDSLKFQLEKEGLLTDLCYDGGGRAGLYPAAHPRPGPPGPDASLHGRAYHPGENALGRHFHTCHFSDSTGRAFR